MSIWFFLWLILSLALLYFVGWTFLILYRQKTAWKSFARKNKFRYRARTLLSSPEMRGKIDSYQIDIFTGEHVTDDARGSRRLNAIEVKLKTLPPFDGALASSGMTRLLAELGFEQSYQPELKEWDGDVVAASDSNQAMKAYLNAERLEALEALMKIKAAWVILIFRAGSALLRFDTPDPLDNVKKLEQITRQMVKATKLLELQDGEESALKSEIKNTKRGRDEVKLEAGEGSVDFELEEDD